MEGQGREDGWDRGRRAERRSRGSRHHQQHRRRQQQRQRHVDLAAVRAEAQTAERTRIAAIRKLGKGVDAKLVEQCITDGSSAEAAARVFLEASQQSTDARLAALKADETQRGAGQGRRTHRRREHSAPRPRRRRRARLLRAHHPHGSPTTGSSR
jgi:hypothetical protein